MVFAILYCHFSSPLYDVGMAIKKNCFRELGWEKELLKY